MEGSLRSRTERRQEQLRALQRLLAATLPANPFYAAKLGLTSRGIPLIDGLAEFARAIPLTTKPELAADQAARPPFGTNLTFPATAYTRLHQTSGTSGRPLRWLDTPESWDRLVEAWAEVYRAAGVGPGDRAYFAFSFGPFIGFWMAFEAAEALGLLCVPGGGLSSVARVQAILDLEITVLCCTPTYALHLAEVATRQEIPLDRSKVRLIIVAGEPGGSIPATRARIEAAWPGARVFDHHGMTEVGPVTFECPAQPGRLHVIESAHLAEVIDPVTGRPVGPGEQGELVLTPLGRTGSPLLRYRTGDLVRPAFPPEATQVAPCACGRVELPLEGGILGRVDDMVIVRGVNVYPAAVEAIIRRFPDVAEYQVTIAERDAMTEMVLRVEPAGTCPDVGGLVRQLDAAFRGDFSLRIPIVAVPPESLPRFELKARRWIRGE
ncbi:MAG: AMP-binding protein [Verrucomicrobiales bacterium]|nr:AMP-binding protein [Verrucomicrobiales bacterium]MCP5527411.1 AMP-binding protein [Verrucomicrobiales bacterium]